jgi:hypothetical protein
MKLINRVNEFRSDVRSLGSVDAFADALKAIEMFHGQYTGVGINPPRTSDALEVGRLVRLFELALVANSGFQHQYNTGCGIRQGRIKRCEYTLPFA